MRGVSCHQAKGSGKKGKRRVHPPPEDGVVIYMEDDDNEIDINKTA